MSENDFDIEKVKTITYDELMNLLKEEDEKKNLRNFINNLFPKGIFYWNTFYAITHPWKVIEHCAYEIKWAWQRVFRGWDDKFVFDLDYNLAKSIPQWIGALRDDNYGGIPWEMYPQEKITDGNYLCNPTKEEDIEARKKWHLILGEIIDGFNVYEDIDWMGKENDENYKKFNHAFDLFREYFSGFWS